MRTIDPILAAAMREGKGEPIARARLYSYDGSGFSYIQSVDLVTYKMLGLSCEIVLSIWYGEVWTIERGVRVAGIEYVEESQYFFRREQRFDTLTGEYHIKGDALPTGENVSASRSADVPAADFVSDVLSDFALSLSVSSSEVWHTWQMFPTGTVLEVTPQVLRNLLDRRYLASIYPRKGGELLVLSPSIYFYGSATALALTDEVLELGYSESRQPSLAWLDEFDVQHTIELSVPVFYWLDIGFVPSSVADATVGKLGQKEQASLTWRGRPNLALEEGDYLAVTVNGVPRKVVITLEEVYKRGSVPEWKQTVKTSPLAHPGDGGQGGALVTSMHGSALLDTSSFDGNLDSTVSTVQALAERVDDLPLAPATTAANDVQVGDGAGNWIKKTLAEFIDILGFRVRLTANRTYYVRTNGNDSNTGLSNTSGGAFLTIQKAIDVVASLDIGIYNVTIQVADGTYTGTISVSSSWVGSGTVTLQGNSGTPANVLISVSGNNAIVVDSGRLTIKDVEIRTTTSGYALHVLNNGVATITNLRFGACASRQINTQGGGVVIASGNYTISGGATVHWAADTGGSILVSAKTITLSGTPAFSSVFASCQVLGSMLVQGNTFSGSATGPRYTAQGNGVIYTAGASTTYLPGNAAHATPTGTGGQYL